MTEKVDMSLDEIIARNKKNKNNKQTGRARLTKAPRSKIRPKISPQKQKQRPQQQQQNQPSTRVEVGQTMLHVSNLHFKVSDKDLKELFEDVAPIKKAAVHYDKSGRSLGTAEVIFWTRDAAMKAIQKYNQRLLDGRPMNINLVPSRTNANVTPRMGVKPGSGVQKRPREKMPGKLPNRPKTSSKGNNVNKNREGKPGRRVKKEAVTAEQLDADLEAYKVTMQVD